MDSGESNADLRESAPNKQREIVAMFDSIAQNYDIANRILSFGIDKKWRKEACEMAIGLCDKESLDIVDIACGTGDMILCWLKATSGGNLSLDSGNSSLARPSREFEKFSLDRQQVLSRSNFSAQPTNLTQDTRIANDLKNLNDSSLQGESQDSRPTSSLRDSHSESKQSKPNRHTEHSEVSKTRESNKNSESMIEKRIDESDSPLQHYDSYNLDSRDLGSSLRATRFAQNDESSADCHESRKSVKETNTLTPNINSIRGIDPSTEMLKIAKEKLPPSVILQNGEAKDLRVDSQSVDILSIAYGLRNVVEVDSALKEFHRVLRKNGILVILEFSKKDNENIFDKIARFYTKRILPYIGGFISKNYAAYKYLPDSVDGFLSLEQIAHKLRALGFSIKTSKRYFCNVCSLIIAQKDLHKSPCNDKSF